MDTFNQSHSFSAILSSESRFSDLEAISYHTVICHKNECIYTGNVNGEVISVPVRQNQDTNSRKIVLGFLPYKEGELAGMYGIHGLALDAVGRVIAVNALGLYIIDSELNRVENYFSEDDHGAKTEERFEYYDDKFRRLKLDRSLRFAYWITGRASLTVIDLKTNQFVVKKFVLSRNDLGKIKLQLRG